MNNIVLKNNFIELKPSEKDRPKSYVSFEVVDVASSQHLFEIFTEGENLTDGYFKMQFSSGVNNSKRELIIEAIKLFINFLYHFSIITGTEGLKGAHPPALSGVGFICSTSPVLPRKRMRLL